MDMELLGVSSPKPAIFLGDSAPLFRIPVCDDVLVIGVVCAGGLSGTPRLEPNDEIEFPIETKEPSDEIELPIEPNP